jgi:hypothetical protein
MCHAQRLTPDGDAKTDLIPGFADGFNRDGLYCTKDDADTMAAFVPLVLELKAPIRLATARVRFTYEAADPAAANRIGSAPEYEYVVGSTNPIRLWLKPGNQARNKASVLLHPEGDFIRPDQWIPADKLGYIITRRINTFYVEGVNPSTQVAGTRIKVEVDPDGDDPVETAEDAVRVTVIKIDLAAETSIEASEEVPGTALALNDDWDCGAKYGDGAGGDHREFEPIWDRDFIGDTPAEKNLLKATLSASPSDLPGDVTLKLFGGETKVRLWPRASKGVQEDIIDATGNGKPYAVSSLPKDIYVEGLQVGRSDLRVTYAYQGLTFADKLNLDVVKLQEHQNGVARVFNIYNTDITFDVQRDTPAAAHYRCLWDVDGIQGFASGPWESTTSPSLTVKYGRESSAAGRVHLEENADNKRKVYAATVRLKGGELKGGLNLLRNIRVALASYHGDSVGETETARRDEVPDLASPPNGFTDTRPTGDFSQQYFQQWYYVDTPPGRRVINDNRLQYSSQPDLIGATIGDGRDTERQVFLMLVGARAYSLGFKYEDLLSIAEHECQHARQNVEISQDGTLWNSMDRGIPWIGYSMCFLEADAYRTGFGSPASWFFLKDTCRFVEEYTESMAYYLTVLPAGDTRNAARLILQYIYRDIESEFIELKRPGYDWYVRPPP